MSGRQGRPQSSQDGRGRAAPHLDAGGATSAEESVAAIKAIDVLNRMDGVYIEKHEHAVVTPRPVIHVHEHVEG